MKIAVVGAFGLMAEAALHDLAADRRVERIYALDINVSRARAVLSRIPAKKKITVIEGDFRKFRQPVDVVYNCAWYELNVAVMDLALKLKAHYVDLGGLYHTTLKQLKLGPRFKAAQKVAVLGCGSTPGITNMMVARLAHSFETIDTVAIYDASHDPTISEDSYLPPFSIRTMLAEFVQPAPILKKGRMVEVAAHSEADELDFRAPIGRVSAGTVIHSETATLPAYLKSKGVKNVFFKIVYPEVVKRQLALLVGMGFAKPEPVRLDGRDLSRLRFLTAMAPPPPFIPPADFEVLRVSVSGRRHGRPLVKTWDCEMRATKLLTAGAMGVGFAGAIAAILCATGKTKLVGGAAAPESALDEDAFFAELKKRKIFSLHETISHPLTV